MISEELKKRINYLFMLDDDMRNRLIDGDVNAIRSLQSIKDSGIKAEEIVSAYESHKLDDLYFRAIRIIQIKELYTDLCNWYVEEKMRQDKKRH